MASTIVVPDPQLIGAYPQKIVEQLYAVATAASADITALQSGGVAGVGPVHFVRAASTTNVTLTAVSTTMDTSVTLVAGDRVLIKDQSTASQNGIYVVGTVVSGPVAPLTRATDFDAASEVQPGSLVVVSEGTASGNVVYQLTTDGPITVGTTNLAFGVAIATALTTDAPANPSSTASASAGTATTAARADHVHNLTALNLAGGSSYVTGVMKAANLPQQQAKGTNLTDADATIAINGGAWRVMPASTLSANDRTITLSASTGTPVAGDQITITRLDTAAHTLTVVDGGTGTPTLFVFANSQIGFATFQFDGTNWFLRQFGVQ